MRERGKRIWGRHMGQGITEGGWTRGLRLVAAGVALALLAGCDVPLVPLI